MKLIRLTADYEFKEFDCGDDDPPALRGTSVAEGVRSIYYLLLSKPRG